VKDVGGIDSAEEQEREFRARLENHEQQLRELNEELDSPTMGRLNFRLNDQRYKRYHARAKQTLGVESDAEVVRKGYQRYLDQQADEHGWSS
jgi:ABC-type Fe3+-citrate transport system substrate-binding protein